MEGDLVHFPDDRLRDEGVREGWLSRGLLGELHH